jgi:DNA modification methylase
LSYQILQGDVIEQLTALAESSVDAIVTDPPYGIRFMGKAWDGDDIVRQSYAREGQAQTPGKNGIPGNTPRTTAAESAGSYDLSPNAMLSFQRWTTRWAHEALRALKPGGHLLSFASCRTYHRMASGVEDAGFEIRDQIGWLFGSGFPKSLNLHGEWGEWAPTERTDKPDIIQIVGAEGAKIRGRNHAVAFGGEELPMFRIGKKAAGDLLDGQQWHQFPEGR